MKTSWTKGLDEQKTMEVKRDYVQGVYLRERLMQLLREKEETSRVSTRSKEAFNSPNWAYLQADAIGYERALNEIISLISE